ncbi:MAG: serine hydrolase domain-containing protein [Acidobacteriota bacterium]
MSKNFSITPLAAAMQNLVTRGDLAGVATLVWRGDRVVHADGAGVRDLESGAPVQRDTIFRIASMSKPVTSVAALKLVDEGRFELDEPIARWAPEFSGMRVLRSPTGALSDTEPAARPITFGDLLTHRAGLTYADFFPGPITAAYADALGGDLDTRLTPDQWIAALAALPLVAHPGAAFHYSHATDLLGLLLARMEGRSLGEVLQARIFAPLGMRDTTFAVPTASRHRQAAACGFDEHGRLAPRREGPGGSFLHERPADWTYESGGQGLWSTVDDYLAFARLFIGGGAVDGVRVLRPETLALMTRDHLTDAQRASTTMLGMPLLGTGHGFGLGVAVVRDPATASPMLCRGHAGTVGWPGAFGGWWQADPVDGSIYVLLSHCMVDLPQLMHGIGLGAYAARTAFHAAASA